MAAAMAAAAAAAAAVTAVIATVVFPFYGCAIQLSGRSSQLHPTLLTTLAQCRDGMKECVEDPSKCEGAMPKGRSGFSGREF